MARSKIIIEFYGVPVQNQVLHIIEGSLGINLLETFKTFRDAPNETLIPLFFPDDGTLPDRYKGYSSTNYKNALNLDVNSTNLFTITWDEGTEDLGLGTVVITANFDNAVFSVVTNTATADILITNENPPDPIDPPDPTFSFTPSSLTFVHKQNGPRPIQNVTMTGNSWRIIAKPYFILSSSTPGVAIVPITDSSGTYLIALGSGNATVGIALDVYYDSEVVFAPADLSGSFNILKDNVQFGVINYTVSVTRLSDFFQIPYAEGQKAFTLDPVFFNFQSANTNTYFQFDALIKTYDFFTNELTENFIPQKVVLFKGKSKVNLGQIIHRLMRKFSEVNETLLQYKYAKLQLTVSENLILDDSVVREGISSEIPFVAGLSRGITDFGFLEFNPKPNRVTKNSFAYLNILIPVGSYELKTFKNGMLINTEALPTNSTTTLCKKVVFNTYTQGDVIEFVLDLVDENNEDAPKKTFCMFPPGMYSNHIVWENEFKLQSAIECTGKGSLDPKLEFQSQKVYKNLVETLEHLSSSKEVKLYIDTGWLLLTDIDTVESLMRTKRAWLIQGDKRISLRPIREKLPPQDYDNELISFPLEFTINRAYDEETYTL
jgi:hypothetical protein